MPTLSHRTTRQKLLIDGLLLFLLILFTGGITAWYVSTEHYFYSWDLSSYQNLALDMAYAFRDSKEKGIYRLLESLSWDHNQLFTLPLVPFILTFGESRLVYILGIALVYLLPFSLIMGAIATKLIAAHPRSVFWLTVLLTLLLPPIWRPTLRGYPDTGGVLLISLAMLAYLQDVRLKKRWQIPVIGVLLALAMLFRRHFAYSSLAFLYAISLYALIRAYVNGRPNLRIVFDNFIGQAVRIGLIAATSLATLILVAGAWVYRIHTTDFNALYDSFKLPFIQVFIYYAAIFYSLAIWLLVVLGFLAGVLTRVIALPSFIFICLFGILSLTQWLIVVRYAGLHYALHFAPFVILGFTAFIWTIWIKLKGKPRTLTLSILGLYIISNFIINFTSLATLNTKLVRPLFSMSTPPLIRTDYDEVVRMIDELRQLAPSRQPIYVAASSEILNYDLMKNAEQKLYGRKGSILNFFVVPTVDSEDFYPLEQLLQAQYVVLARPLQTILASKEEQDLVKVVFDAFTQNWEIAQDFKRLPVEFPLQQGTVVSIYQRTRPTSQETAVRTLHIIQQQIGERPGNQLDWIVLNNLFPSKIISNADKTYKIVTHPSYRNKQPKTSYLYIGKLPPNQAGVTGTITFKDNRCVGLSLQVSMLSKEGKVLRVSETVHSPGQQPNFNISLQNSNAAYLLLDVVSPDNNNRIDYCSTEINNLSVSN